MITEKQAINAQKAKQEATDTLLAILAKRSEWEVRRNDRYANVTYEVNRAAHVSVEYKHAAWRGGYYPRGLGDLTVRIEGGYEWKSRYFKKRKDGTFNWVGVEAAIEEAIAYVTTQAARRREEDGRREDMRLAVDNDHRVHATPYGYELNVCTSDAAKIKAILAILDNGKDK